MCGFVGIATTRATVSPETVTRARDTLAHRGPDDAGHWISPDGRVALGHRRLSIIDPSPCGRQPMADATGDLHVVFNGEIYNYRELRDELAAAGARFTTGSDTEVLLAAYRAWGADCLERLTGMFAFALHDAPRRRLMLARDRVGEKPLFYRADGDGIAFASELKALLALPGTSRAVDRRALEHYLAFGYVPGEQCILAGVRKLPAAHAMLVGLDGGAPEIWRYWSLPDGPASGPGTDDVEALTDELEALLDGAVRRQLVADVPIGVLLSGGLDSSLVTALAARASSEPVRTFTIALPGHGGFDEGPYARLVASHFGTRHVELTAEPASVELLPRLARQFDEPMADSSMVPTYLVSRLVREHATVALGGDGGDELFGGYPHYGWLTRHERLRRVVPRPMRRIAGYSAALLPVGIRGRNYAIGVSADLPYAIAHVNLYFDRRTRDRLLSPLGGATAGPEGFKAELSGSRGGVVARATRVDFLSYLTDDILVKVDRASMLASLEVRAPFLDHRLIEFAFGLPDHLRATEAGRKVLLRRLAGRLLPASLDLTRKQGFSLPLAAWFKGEWGRYIEGLVRELPTGTFSQRVVDELLRGQARGRTNTQRLFALAMLELWRREYDVTFPA